FEFALRERAARLANFRHAYYARVRRIDRHPSGLAIVSDHVEGIRLSDMLRVTAERGLSLDLNAALCLLRQIVPSIALLHENARDVAHGLLAPERLIVTPRARVVVVEHVLGSAVEQLQFNRDRLWQDLRIAAPASAGAIRFDRRADVTAIGLVALALVLGRPIAAAEYPGRIASLLNDARARTAGADDQSLPDALHNWIARALQLDVRQGFQSATEAQIALEEALGDVADFVAAPIALETFLSRYIAVMLDPMPPQSFAALPPPIAIVSPVSAPQAPSPAAFQFSPEAHVVPPASPAPAVSSGPLQVSHAPVASAPAAALQITTVPAPPAPIPPPVAHLPNAPQVATRLDAPAPASPLMLTKVSEPHTAAPAAPVAAARDIADLLGDFDLPPVTGAHEARQDAGAPAAPPPADAGSGGAAGGRARWRRVTLVALAVAALGEGGFIAARALRKTPAPKLGTLSLQTNPPGVAVFVDGVSRGNTPARISLDPGSHLVELRGRGVPRVIPVTVTAGAEASQYLELPETPSSGSLLVQSDPAGARVSVDGVDHGLAPATVADLAPGEHEVVLQADGGPAVRQRVVIQAGVTSSVLAPVSTASAGPVSGWLSVKAPFSIEVREGGRLIGTTEADRIMMAAGRHDLELVNETLGYRVARSIQVPAGKVTPLSVELPQGVLNVNASPWAEVWIDGRRVGETPIGNLPLSIGPHEVVFRHPQLGEKRQAVSVTLKAPVRLSIDMKQ
ncbi:MAG: PEGA domain-containing protein, partial [Vicinamibacterales bacterium]